MNDTTEGVSIKTGYTLANLAQWLRNYLSNKYYTQDDLK